MQGRTGLALDTVRGSIAVIVEARVELVGKLRKRVARGIRKSARVKYPDRADLGGNIVFAQCLVEEQKANMAPNILFLLRVRLPSSGPLDSRQNSTFFGLHRLASKGHLPRLEFVAVGI